MDERSLLPMGILETMQLQGGTKAPFVHTIEMLDWATGGPAPEAIGPLKDSGHPIEALVELAKQTARVD